MSPYGRASGTTETGPALLQSLITRMPCVVLQAVKLIDQYGEIEENLSLAQNVVLMQNCCKRAFIRGAFLGSRFDQRSGKVLPL